VIAPRRRAARRAARPAADTGAAERAIADLLDAVVPPSERGAADLVDTPSRVAEAWRDDLLDGYRCDPAAVLADAMPARGQGLVAITGIDVHSMCPHHLLPSRGLAHVAYVPGGKVAGFGQIARLVDCFAHRLVLQEDLARQVAEALAQHLGAAGAACVLDMEQACLSMRGARRREARTHAQCFVGTLASDRRLQARFEALVASGRRTPGRAVKAVKAGNAGARPGRARRSR
jgi:GTP cyclohydrolase I